MIILLGLVAGMVARRAALFASGMDGTAPGKLLRAQAERLVVELGEGWSWDEMSRDLGKSNRIQRGSEVSSIRNALNPGHAVRTSGHAPRRGHARQSGRPEDSRRKGKSYEVCGRFRTVRNGRVPVASYGKVR
jgi:hypothetical protein